MQQKNKMMDNKKTKTVKKSENDLSKAKKVVSKNSKRETNLIFIIENYLNERYNFRLNIVSHDVEVKAKDSDIWEKSDEDSLWIEMQKENIKVPKGTLEILMRSTFVPKYNPFIYYFENLPKYVSDTDYIRQYAGYLQLQEGENMEQFVYHFRKWCVRAVKCATIDIYFNKNAIVLSDDARGQNIGKTTWIRSLCPPILANYYKENLPRDEKDAKISLAENFIINLDEMASLSKIDINNLKSLLSTDQVKVRFPYAKKDVKVNRVCSFIGSTNKSEFLQDETGSVRWLCFIVEKIDWSYSKDFDMNNLWMQAKHLASDVNFDERINTVDVEENELRNNKFQISTAEKDLVSRYFTIPTAEDKLHEILTITDIIQYIYSYVPNIKLINKNMGQALTAFKFPKKRTSNGVRYCVIKSYQQ